MPSESIVASPLWWDAARPPSLSVRAVPATCDVAVIGAGIAGLSAALTLAEAGRSVQIFDAQRPGAGAATHNAGIASAGLPVGFARLIARVGDERTRVLYQEAHEAHQALLSFLTSAGIQCDYQSGGAVYATPHPAQMDSLAREAQFCEQQLGIEAYTVLGAELGNELVAEGYAGALVRADAGTLQPARLHAALLSLAMSAGVQIHGETPVTRLVPGVGKRDGQGAILQTMRGRTQAQDVVVTADGAADKSDPWGRRRILPVPLRVITTEPLPGEVLSRLMPSGRVLIEAARIRHIARPSPDGARLMFAGFCRHGGAATAAATEALRLRMVATFPALETYSISHSWAGVAGFHRNGMPKLYSHGNVHYVHGLGGLGLVLSQWLARKVAWRLIEDERGTTAFAESGSGIWPPGSRKRWFLPTLSTWMRMRELQ